MVIKTSQIKSVVFNKFTHTWEFRDSDDYIVFSVDIFDEDSDRVYFQDCNENTVILYFRENGVYDCKNNLIDENRESMSYSCSIIRAGGRGDEHVYPCAICTFGPDYRKCDYLYTYCDQTDDWNEFKSIFMEDESE